MKDKDKNKTSHVTPVGGNVFLDLGFDEAEAKALKAEAEIIIKNKMLEQATEIEDE